MNAAHPLMKLVRAKEAGLVLVILELGSLLATFATPISQKVRDPATGRVIGEVTVNRFLQRPNLDLIIKNCSWTAVMAVGATILIIAGGIDLSIGAIYCLAGVAGGIILRNYGADSTGWSVALGVLVSILVGCLCGMANGLMVVLLRVHPFIITLGSMLIFRGIAFIITKGQPVTDYPPAFGAFFRQTVAEFTVVPIMIVLVVVAAGHVFLRHAVAGREAYAVGGNELASRFSGIRVWRVKILVFALAGLTGGIASVISLGVFESVASDAGKGYELDVIAAAVVGGASLSGGRGTALGALLGALVIQLIANGIVILEIEQNYTEIIKGGVIVAAVVLDRMSAEMGRRRLVRTA
jgi:ribose transport system permease protein